MVMLAAVWISTACERKDTLEQRVVMPISICLPADAVTTPARKPGMNRMPGDVGATEDLLLPKYIYFFIVKQIDADNWKVWNTVTINDADEHWEKHYYDGSLMGNMDSVYRYTEDIILPLFNAQFNGRVYAIASTEALTFDATLNGVQYENGTPVFIDTFPSIHCILPAWIFVSELLSSTKT